MFKILIEIKDDGRGVMVEVSDKQKKPTKYEKMIGAEILKLNKDVLEDRAKLEGSPEADD